MTTLTSKIFNANAPFGNSYQGDGLKIVFVCSVGMLRSPTFADVANSMNGKFNARSCGSSSVALIPLSVNLITWADKIVFMNRENKDEAIKTFEAVGYDEDINMKAIVAGVDDDFPRNDPKLIRIAKNFLENSTHFKL